MTIQIQDGTGTGRLAHVNSSNQLETHAAVTTQQHYFSEKFGQSYQVHGITDTLTAATVPILHIKNTSVDKEIVINDIRHQVVDVNSTLPAVDNYVGFGFGRTYSSGGTAIVPTNLNTGSGNEAEALCYHSTPTLAGTNVEIDRHYTLAEAEDTEYREEGSIIIAPNDTFEVYYVSTSTAGIAYARVSFYMEPIGFG